MHSQVVTIGRHIIALRVIISAHAVTIHIVKSGAHFARLSIPGFLVNIFFMRLSQIYLDGNRLFLDIIVLTCDPEKLEDPRSIQNPLGARSSRI